MYTRALYCKENVNFILEFVNWVHTSDTASIVAKSFQKSFKIISTFHIPCNYSERIFQ